MDYSSFEVQGSHKKVKIKFFEAERDVNVLELLEANVADPEIFYEDSI